MCFVGLCYGEQSIKYSFPSGHPLNAQRVQSFWDLVESQSLLSHENLEVWPPLQASEDAILLFHTQEYVDFVKKASELGSGYLDSGDTPAFKGVFEASSYVVGAVLDALDKVVKGKVQHAFVPVSGLHHARRSRAAGFCVFNDSAIAILQAEKMYGFKRIFYVDIDAHHGDGVFYGFYDDPRVLIADIHEDGRYLYPGTGLVHETGSDAAIGTKMNIPLPPGSGDEEFRAVFPTVESFGDRAKPDLIIFQCGADGLKGDPLTHLEYTASTHRYAAERLHNLAHKHCSGRLLALGGGGYNPLNTAEAWLEVVKALLSDSV